MENIMVEDRSTDTSAKMAKKWSDIYPDNIILIQKNCDQASARNVGLQHVLGE